jgi:O-acetylserine/cysteine efflux transporter
MNTNRGHAVAALTAAGLLWGTTVPLSKLALEWLPPGWLTFARFGLAAAVLLAVAGRRGVRAACTPRVLASGALGYGGSVVVQNAGITRTSVIHAALLIGTVPVMVAVIAALWRRTVARPVAWAGFAVSLAGVGLVTGGRGGGATAAGDGLVLASLLLSATFTVAQGGLLRGRDPVAVTAVQFLGAALAVLPFSVITEGAPPAPPAPGAAAAVVALAAGGTVLPFTLFAYGQSRVSAEVAGAFYNIEPLVGAVIGVVAFGDPAGLAQAVGGTAIVAGIALSSLPLLSGGTRRSAAPRAPLAGQQPVDDLVAALAGEGEPLAQHPFLDEAQAAGQGAAALVRGLGVQRDPVDAERTEPVIENRGHGSRRQPAALVPAVDPVADLRGARVRGDVQAHRPGQAPLAPVAHRDRHRQFQARQPVPRAGLQERARLFSCRGSDGPRLPAGQPLAVGHEQGMVGVGDRGCPQHQGLVAGQREAEHRRRNRGHRCAPCVAVDRLAQSAQPPSASLIRALASTATRSDCVCGLSP